VTAGAPPFPAAPDALGFWRRLAPARIALVDRGPGRRVSYAELDAAVPRAAAALDSLGVGRGDRVAALAENRVELVELFFACGRLGAALVPLNWRLAPAELAAVLADARPALVVGEGRHRAAAEQALGTAGAPRWVDLDAELPALVRRAEPWPHAGAVGADDAALVLYTSGSTGRPKGVVIPHRQLFYNAVATTTAWELGPADVAPVSTPLFHTGGWNVFATPLWRVGGTVVLFPRFDADDFLAGLAAERCTFALTVPTQLVMLRDSARWGVELPSLRAFMAGGAPCPPALADAVRGTGYTLRAGYGLTECGPNCFAISDAEALARPGSVGWPVPFLEMRLAGADGADALPGEPGELLLRGPQLFGGYLHSPERTAEVMTDGGWLRTGDLAARDADGAYTICGRRKEMYISGGENVFPGEVEAALSDHPAVAEVVVVGVPDARWGEKGCAFVVARPESRLTCDELSRFARTRLAGYKVPRQVVFLGELPRLGSGKPDRRALAALAVT
jgi:fatty-acyl-CoA synthase